MAYVQSNAPVAQPRLPLARPLSGPLSARASQMVEKIRAVADGTVVAFRRGGTANMAIDGVFATYDLCAISPREIDILAAKLTALGFRDKSFLRMLTKRGARALSSSQEGFARIGYRVSGFNPREKLDLLQLSREQIALYTAFGQPTGDTEAFLDDLTRIETAKRQKAALPQRARGPESGVLYLSPSHRV